MDPGALGKHQGNRLRRLRRDATYRGLANDTDRQRSPKPWTFTHPPQAHRRPPCPECRTRRARRIRQPSLSVHPMEGAACDANRPCGDGLVCDIVQGPAASPATPPSATAPAMAGAGKALPQGQPPARHLGQRRQQPVGGRGCGTILKWDGKRWLRQQSGTGWGCGVFGQSTTQVWAVGEKGRSCGDGQGWVAQSSGVMQTLNAVAGVASPGAHCGRWGRGRGAQGDRQSWVQQGSSTTEALSALWVGSATRAWAVGARGRAVRWDGSAWSTVSTNSVIPLHGVFSGDPTVVWAVGDGGLILKWDGTMFGPASSPTTNNWQGLWGSDASNIWTVGDSGNIARWNGNVWVGETGGGSGNLYGISGSGSAEIWSVGDAGIVNRREGTSWARNAGGPVGPTTRLGHGGRQRLDGGQRRPNPALGRHGLEQREQPDAVDAQQHLGCRRQQHLGGGGQRRHHPLGWQRLEDAVGHGHAHLAGIAGSSTSNVFVVGDIGASMRWDGSGWVAAASGTNFDLFAVWASRYRQGVRRRQRWHDHRANGTAWGPQTSAINTDLYTVFGLDASNVWAAGLNGGIVRYSGSAWGKDTSPLTESPDQPVGTDASNLYAVGGSGAIVHWNGSQWQTQQSGTSNALSAVWGSDATHLWLVGGRATRSSTASRSKAAPLDATPTWSAPRCEPEPALQQRGAQRTRQRAHLSR